MPKLGNRKPKYRLHKTDGRAVVTINGRDVFLGKFGIAASRVLYDQIIAQWEALGRQDPGRLSESLATIDELIIGYVRFAETYYVKNGQPTTTQQHIKNALKPLHEFFGTEPAEEFVPLKLKTLRQQLIERGLARTTINKNVGIIRRMFRWGVESELVSSEAYQRLTAVAGLRRGRTTACETMPVKPVPDAWVDAVLDHVSGPVAAMIQLQRFTGMRPGEVVIMRTCDIQMTGKVWEYTPESHKTEHHGRRRKIYLGPRAQDVVRPFLRAELDAYIFSPADAERVRREIRHQDRIAPLSSGNRPGTNRSRRPRRPPGDRYTSNSYHRAITRGCDLAFPPPDELARVKVNGRKGRRWETPTQWRERLGESRWCALKQWIREHRWHPNQLRHNAATELRRQFGIEAARVVLGHASTAVTEVYAEIDFMKAADIMGQVG